MRLKQVKTNKTNIENKYTELQREDKEWHYSRHKEESQIMSYERKGTIEIKREDEGRTGSLQEQSKGGHHHDHKGD